VEDVGMPALKRVKKAAERLSANHGHAGRWRMSTIDDKRKGRQIAVDYL